MWTSENRARYDCGRPCSPSDLRAEEWALTRGASRISIEIIAARALETVRPSIVVCGGHTLTDQGDHGKCAAHRDHCVDAARSRQLPHPDAGDDNPCRG